MAVPRPLRRRVRAADFAQLVREPATEAGRLQRGADLVVALVGGCDHAGVSVLTPAFMETVAVTDEVGRRGDGWQHELSEGPGLDTARSRTTVVSQDLRSDPRWRSWGPRAVTALGLRAAMSVLLDTRGESVGSLTLYADRPDVWDDERQTLAVTLADQLALASADARMLDDRHRALLARGGVGQAQGIVMERFGMTADQALEHLRRLSEGNRMTLVRLAEHVVESRQLPPWLGDDPAAPGRSRP